MRNEKANLCKRSVRIQNRSTFTLDRMGEATWGRVSYDLQAARDGQTLTTIPDALLGEMTIGELSEAFRHARERASTETRAKELAGRIGVILAAKINARAKLRGF
ncbi:MAG: hypothetical protein HC875_20690 [Anaerolineales bacterium]|nr:hypothetical protein [Anaerolineales bacterium]